MCGLLTHSCKITENKVKKNLILEAKGIYIYIHCIVYHEGISLNTKTSFTVGRKSIKSLVLGINFTVPIPFH